MVCQWRQAALGHRAGKICCPPNTSHCFHLLYKQQNRVDTNKHLRTYCSDPRWADHPGLKPWLLKMRNGWLPCIGNHFPHARLLQSIWKNMMKNKDEDDAHATLDQGVQQQHPQTLRRGIAYLHLPNISHMRCCCNPWKMIVMCIYIYIYMFVYMSVVYVCMYHIYEVWCMYICLYIYWDSWLITLVWVSALASSDAMLYNFLPRPPARFALVKWKSTNGRLPCIGTYYHMRCCCNPCMEYDEGAMLDNFLRNEVRGDDGVTMHWHILSHALLLQSICSWDELVVIHPSLINLDAITGLPCNGHIIITRCCCNPWKMMRKGRGCAFGITAWYQVCNNSA